ncbi:MAG: hypothetical protein E7375_03260 [Clostridiales bacterium]|nr:hypothetical protein [Clostridiales bacterium]
MENKSTTIFQTIANKMPTFPIIKSNKIFKLSLTILLAGLILFSTACSPKVDLDYPSLTVEEDHSGTSEQQSDHSLNNGTTLENMELSYSEENTLSYKTSQELAQNVVKELQLLYSFQTSGLSPVVNTNNLTSMFFFESTFSAKEFGEPFVGIGQVGLPVVKDSVAKINRLCSLAEQNILNGNAQNKNKLLVQLQNSYCYKYIKNASPEEIYEKCKSDPIMCGTISGVSLATISDRRYTAFQENQILVLFGYNQGDDFVAKMLDQGVLIFDGKTVTIDSKKLSSLDEKTFKSFSDGYDYVTKVIGGSKLLETSTHSNAVNNLDQYRQKVNKVGPENIDLNGLEYK